MKRQFILTFVLLVTVAVSLGARAQGYIVPNGVTYAGWSFGAWEIDVVHNPTNYESTAFAFRPWGITPPSIYTNTYQFGAMVDVSVRVFLVSSKDPISLQPILSGSYSELTTYPSPYVFPSGIPFYLGLYTGNQEYYPPNGIYSDPLFGWAQLVNNQGVIELLDGALAYKAGGIYAGTLNLIPEPSTFALLTVGCLLLGWRLRRVGT